jgi:hypothetical protein
MRIRNPGHRDEAAGATGQAAPGVGGDVRRRRQRSGSSHHRSAPGRSGPVLWIHEILGCIRIQIRGIHASD